MEQIELVIKIPKEHYDMIVKYDFLDAPSNNAIRNGRILPKGHGALKDIDAIIAEHAMTKYDWSDCVDIEDLRDFPTIIEADKEERKCTYADTGCGSCEWQIDCPRKEGEE